MTRDEIEIAIFDAVDPATPESSWRQQVIDLALQLDQMGALSESDIQQMRESRKRMHDNVNDLLRS